MTGRAAFHADAAESRLHSLRLQDLGLRCPEAAVASPRIRLDRRVIGGQSDLLRSSRSDRQRLPRSRNLARSHSRAARRKGYSFLPDTFADLLEIFAQRIQVIAEPLQKFFTGVAGLSDDWVFPHDLLLNLTTLVSTYSLERILRHRSVPATTPQLIAFSSRFRRFRQVAAPSQPDVGQGVPTREDAAASRPAVKRRHPRARCAGQEASTRRCRRFAAGCADKSKGDFVAVNATAQTDAVTREEGNAGRRVWR